MTKEEFLRVLEDLIERYVEANEEDEDLTFKLLKYLINENLKRIGLEKEH